MSTDGVAAKHGAAKAACCMAPTHLAEQLGLVLAAQFMGLDPCCARQKTQPSVSVPSAQLDVHRQAS